MDSIDSRTLASLLSTVVAPRLQSQAHELLEGHLLAVKSGMGMIELAELQWKTEDDAVKGRAVIAIIAAQGMPQACVDELKAVVDKWHKVLDVSMACQTPPAPSTPA